MLDVEAVVQHRFDRAAGGVTVASGMRGVDVRALCIGGGRRTTSWICGASGGLWGFTMRFGPQLVEGADGFGRQWHR